MENKESKTFKLKGILCSGKNGCPSPLPENKVYVESLERSNDIADIALLSNRAYGKIFGKNRSEETGERRLVSVVRITRGDKVIRRMYRYDSSVSGIGTFDIALTMSSIGLLTKSGGRADNILGEDVKVTKGNMWDVHEYYLNHPSQATRISYKLGMLSVVLALLSIVLTIIQML